MKEYIELAKKAVDEEWDAFRIMAAFMALQKELDARIADSMGYSEIAEKIRQQ